MIFWIIWGIDSLVTLGFVFFFVDGLADGSISSFNIVLWLGMLVALGAVMGGSLALKSIKQKALSIILLCLLAVPALLFGLFFLVLIFSHPRWN